MSRTELITEPRATTCPAIIISGPASNQGKTIITASLAYYHRQKGLNVRVFKVGPDFLDPTILEEASRNPVYQLDLWMVGRENCRRLLYEAAQKADLILIEGVMGLFDGYSSTADLAKVFDIPVVAVIRAESMAQTFHAVAQGLAGYDRDIKLSGIFANAVGSSRHENLLAESASKALPFLGSLARAPELTLPSRHLGLASAWETEDLDSRLAVGAQRLGKTALSKIPAQMTFLPAAKQEDHKHLLKGKSIAVACDAAFAFIYRRNLEFLQECGAVLKLFSPLREVHLPACDAIYLPGGYPELHLTELSRNYEMRGSIAMHLARGGRIYAECGGMLYLLDSLTDKHGRTESMIGLIPGKAVMGNRLKNLAYQELEIGGKKINGHTFHYSQAEIKTQPSAHALNPFSQEPGEAFYELNLIKASYVHFYFDSNPTVAASFFA